MNIIEAMRVWNAHLKHFVGMNDKFASAMKAVDSIVVEYDALAPDWKRAPEWARWYAIDCHNVAFWFDAPEPLITYDNDSYDAPTWANNAICKFAAHIGLLPFGIDWRLCKWQRPEAQP